MADKPPRICQVLDVDQERYGELRRKFSDRFGHSPAFYVRAPGRVNLIGEHVDYCGYAVLPMALEQDVVVAVAPNDIGKTVLANVNPQYPEFECVAGEFPIDKSAVRWYNYMLCGIRGAAEHVGAGVLQGFNALVWGRVPQSAGLSSSSALVCSAAVTVAQVNGWQISLRELSELTARCERYVGTEGGGMDQAISLLAHHGMAKLIEFNPLRTTDVHLPPGAAFVVSNSLAEHNKAATSDFNTRVVECRLAAQVMAKGRGLAWREVRRLGDLQKALGLGVEEMMSVVEAGLAKEPYARDQVCAALGVSDGELVDTCLSQNTAHVTTFHLYQRASHVYSEALRVMLFKDVCEEAPPDALQRLGRLMDDSHASCRDLYSCSHPEVDSLVQHCKEAGGAGVKDDRRRLGGMRRLTRRVQQGHDPPDQGQGQLLRP